MSSVNMVTLIGNLGQDPELKQTRNDNSFCRFSLATTEHKKDKNGQSVPETTWHNICVFSKQADSCAKYLNKGSKVYVQGKIEIRNYEDKEGIKRISYAVIAQTVKFLDPFKKTDNHDIPKIAVPAQDLQLDNIPF